MNEQSLNNSEVRPEQVAKKKHQTIKLGLDVHADWIVVVRLLDHSGPQPAQKFTPAKFLEWVKSQMALSDAVHSCYEAGPFGYGLHRALIALGVQNVVVQPVCLDERHTGVNQIPGQTIDWFQSMFHAVRHSGSVEEVFRSGSSDRRDLVEFRGSRVSCRSLHHPSSKRFSKKSRADLQ